MPHQQVTVLLNISPDGMACRADAAAAALLTKGDLPRARFKLSGRNEEFHLTARVCNKTPGSGGGTILGLQWIDSPHVAEQLADLKRVLNHSQREATPRELCV